MKVVVHDYAGHAFTAQLGRALARFDDVEVLYLSFEGFDSPKGRVDPSEGDPETFSIRQLTIGQPVNKDNLAVRWLQQRKYARILSDVILSERPDFFLSSAPIEVQEAALSACHKIGARFTFWVQDIHSEAIERILSNKSRLLGQLAGRYYRRKESSLLQRSDAVVTIAEEFRDLLSEPRWGLDVGHMEVVENWANIADIPLLPRDNVWSAANLRPNRPRIVYSGTLARKHNPDLLLELARNLEADVYLFSQGSGADHVRESAISEGLDNVIVRPWVSVEDLPFMLASADILFAVIEADAGIFSVPSKVLSYLAAGRPILASIPSMNLAAATVKRTGAGLVAEPNDIGALLSNARLLLNDPDQRKRMGAAGRAYAEETFDINAISRQFKAIFLESTRSKNVRDTMRL